MAAASSTVKSLSLPKRKSINDRAKKKGTNEFRQQLPDEKEREADHFLDLLMLDGSWQERRVIWTKQAVVFSHTDKQTVVDVIPLHEITGIREHHESAAPNQSSLRKKQDTSMKSLKLSKKFSFSQRGRENSLHQNSEHSDSGANVNKTTLLQNTLTIETISNGYNAGRSYILKAQTPETCRQVVSGLVAVAAVARKAALAQTRFRRSQAIVERMYDSFCFQASVALLIVVNFATNIVSSQMADELTYDDGSPTPEGVTLERLDLFFTCFFAFELSMNLYAHWISEFFNDGWNILDLIVVILSLVALALVNMPINVIRMTRAFRVVRIFGRLKSLRNLIHSIAAAILPVFNAFIILLIVIAIGAIMAVSFFSDQAPNEFGKFERAFYCLFRTLAGDPTYPIPALHSDGTMDYGGALFYIGFYVVGNWIVWQVSVAILVDRFIATNKQMQLGDILEEETSRRMIVSNTLDPLLSTVLSEYVDDSDLTVRLLNLFELLDREGAGKISFMELCWELRKLDLEPRIHLTESDSATFAPKSSLANCQDSLDGHEFEFAMREQLHLFVIRQLSIAALEVEAGGTSGAPVEGIMCRAIKMIAQDLHKSERQLVELRDQATSTSHAMAAMQQKLDRILSVLDLAANSSNPTPAVKPCMTGGRDEIEDDQAADDQGLKSIQHEAAPVHRVHSVDDSIRARQGSDSFDRLLTVRECERLLDIQLQKTVEAIMCPFLEEIHMLREVVERMGSDSTTPKNTIPRSTSASVPGAVLVSGVVAANRDETHSVRKVISNWETNAAGDAGRTEDATCGSCKASEGSCCVILPRPYGCHAEHCDRLTDSIAEVFDNASCSDVLNGGSEGHQKVFSTRVNLSRRSAAPPSGRSCEVDAPNLPTIAYASSHHSVLEQSDIFIELPFGSRQDFLSEWSPDIQISGRHGSTWRRPDDKGDVDSQCGKSSCEAEPAVDGLDAPNGDTDRVRERSPSRSDAVRAADQRDSLGRMVCMIIKTKSDDLCEEWSPTDPSHTDESEGIALSEAEGL